MVTIKKKEKKEQRAEEREDFDISSSNQQNPNTCKADSALCIPKYTNISFKRMCFYVHVTLSEGSQ
jgi:hypothetical protein